MSNRVGAPKGARVHWILLHLNSAFFNAYKCFYRYSNHNYIFYRFVGNRKKINDLFVVCRTSKKCFRLMYVNIAYDVYFYRSFATSKECAVFMLKMFDIYRKTVDYKA